MYREPNVQTARGGTVIEGYVKICRGRVAVIDDEPQINPAQIILEGKNLILTAGYARMAELAVGRLLVPEGIGYGSGTTAPTIGDLTLENELGRKALTRRLVSGNVSNFQMLLREDEANGLTLTEAGLFDSSAAGLGVLLGRFVHAAIPKDSGIAITYVWTWSFS